MNLQNVSNTLWLNDLRYGQKGVKQLIKQIGGGDQNLKVKLKCVRYPGSFPRYSKLTWLLSLSCKTSNF